MLELDTIYQIDVLDGFKLLDDNSIDLIITSPPYNKVGLSGVQMGPNWHTTIDYNGERNNDNMQEDEYQAWQLAILRECYRVLKDDGSLFYNHKNRICKGTICTPYEWLLQSPLKIRQEIVWDRISDQNVNNCRYIPTTERIYWLTKTTHPRFIRQKDCLFKGEVWGFRPKCGTQHPAPFPLELPNAIIPHVAQGSPITILDPFMGSGTVAIAAIQNGCHYIGFEKFQTYVDMANNRIHDFQNRELHSEDTC